MLLVVVEVVTTKALFGHVLEIKTHMILILQAVNPTLTHVYEQMFHLLQLWTILESAVSHTHTNHQHKLTHHTTFK